jgi:hypothetical protein
MRKILCITAALFVAGSAFAAGEVWRWKDSNGTWHYSDQPQPGAELVRRSGRVDTPAAAAPGAAPAPAVPPGTTATVPLPVSDAVAAEVRQDAAARKADQCKKAEESYQKAMTARVFPRTDANGNQTFLTSAEIDTFRLQARAVRDTACAPGA